MNEENYIPTKAEARKWVADFIFRRTYQWDWDQIAESFDPVLEQDGCNVVAEQLGSCVVQVIWPDGEIRTFDPADE